MKDTKDLHIDTLLIHAGQEPDATTGAIMTPIYQTSTYVQSSPGVHKGYAYARGKNPTRVALEKCIASLENAKHGLCFSSGMGLLSSYFSSFANFKVKRVRLLRLLLKLLF